MLKKLIPPVAAVLLLTLCAAVAAAHEHRNVHEYNFVFGFIQEPAFEGIMNGVYVHVTKVAEHGHGEEPADEMSKDEDESHDTEEETEEGEHGHGGELIAGVTGLENTLQVEITHVPSGATRPMRLHAFSGDPGHYKSDFIPTSTGQFVFHLIGTIEGKQIDERFESGVGTFDDVQPATAIQFPESAASFRELESAVRGALESAQQAQDTALAVEAAADGAQSGASTATTLAIVGIVVGAIGIVVGAIGAVTAFRRRNSSETDRVGRISILASCLSCTLSA